MSDRLTAEQVGELKRVVDRHPLENITFVWGLLPALIAAAERDEQWTQIIADETAETMRLMEALGVVEDVQNGTACMDAMLAKIASLKAAEARVRGLEAIVREGISWFSLIEHRGYDVPHSMTKADNLAFQERARTALGKEERT